MLPELASDLILKDAPEVEGYKVLGPCVLHSKIGQGGMGAVYRGLHLNLSIEVAVKCLLPGLASVKSELITRFEREAHLAARVTHQNLVRVYDIGQEHGLHYLVMEYVSGETLRERVSRRGRSSIEEAVTIIRQAAAGLAAAHDEGIVHRDIKPENIMVAAAKKLVKVADLGLSRLNESDVNLTASMIRMGTPPYMPPEQWKSFASVDRPGDLWALGATLYYLLVGQNAFIGTVYAIERHIREQSFPEVTKERPEVPEDLAAVVRKCTERNPDDRYLHARELEEALAAVAAKHEFKSTMDEIVGSEAKLSPSAVKRNTALPQPPASVLEQLRSHTVTIAPVTHPRASANVRKTRLAAGVIALVVLISALGFAWQRWSRSIAGFDFKGANAQGYDEYVHEKSGIVMVHLPGGSFWIGSRPQDVDAKKDEQPAHRVTLPPFLIAKYEVSQEEWLRQMDDNPAVEADRGADRPVSNVTWVECAKFCAKVGLSLPTEAQWEYACRANGTSSFASGNAIGRDAANFDAGDTGRSMPVNSYGPNAFGLFNLHGNVCEWCEDVYDESYNGRRAVDRGAGQPDERKRVYRGGGYLRDLSDCRSAARQHDHPSDFRDPDMGFRPVFNLPAS